ncbi:STAS domain-containing protein [Amycolatopsis nigrescens]|uniref:STAS domain-containing protein n=1 Tax=Amycolatopsis nigrescens TaxID=381445 RepID=UPI00058C59D9|nr:STAS domain-containing protein [Amycolatopsis nigrescens]
MAAAAESNAPTPGFTVTVADGARVVVTGELDLLTGPQLQEALTKLLDERRSSRIIADLTGVTFFDSSALNVLLQAQRQAAELQVALSVVPSRQVRRVIELTGVAEHLELTP